jgi:MEKHLA domain-containing protein
VHRTGPVEFHRQLTLKFSVVVPMNLSIREPCEENQFLSTHVGRLLASLRRWTGRDLVDRRLPMVDQARQIFAAPFVMLSHDIAADPMLNYGNRAGLRLFELSWRELIRTPSRLTAEPVHRDERASLLDQVTRLGYIDDYRGVRISKSGRRFMIEKATVWTVVDENGAPCGQAATFSEWNYLDGEGKG